ncbi:MAG: hypothetical protein M1828_005132 [Chrysothrix sp. TS-e1954]|nr:MAG: hypothetical protein M1828_005132 [Chrysothrix sp. TS-e1954]
MTSNSVSTRLLILSDTHDFDITSFSKLPPVDVVLHCGDLTENGDLASLKTALTALGSIKAELKLVIAGNHDVVLDRGFFTAQGGRVEEYDEAIAFCKSTTLREQNVHYLEEGYHEFTLNSGAHLRIWATPHTPEYGISAFQYPSRQDRFNALSSSTPEWAECVATDRSIIPDQQRLDIVMSHGPPKYILDSTNDGNSGGCEHLRRAIAHARPQLHCFGHIHGAWGARRVAWTSQLSKLELEDLDIAEGDGDPTEDAIMFPAPFIGKNSSKKKGYATPGRTEGSRIGKETLFVNAAIGNDDGTAENAPWIVDLELGKRP